MLLLRGGTLKDTILYPRNTFGSFQLLSYKKRSTFEKPSVGDKWMTCLMTSEESVVRPHIVTSPLSLSSDVTTSQSVTQMLRHCSTGNNKFQILTTVDLIVEYL